MWDKDHDDAKDEENKEDTDKDPSEHGEVPLGLKILTNEFVTMTASHTNLESKDGENKDDGRGDAGSDDDSLRLVQHAHHAQRDTLGQGEDSQ